MREENSPISSTANLILRGTGGQGGREAMLSSEILPVFHKEYSGQGICEV